MRRLVPSRSTSSLMRCCVPDPMDTIRTTEPTPKITPNVVNALLNGFTRKARAENRIKSRDLMTEKTSGGLGGAASVSAVVEDAAIGQADYTAHAVGH